MYAPSCSPGGLPGPQRTTLLRALSLVLLAFLLSGCAGRYLKRGDALARKGQWEEALQEYRHAAEIRKSNLILDRVAKAEREVAAGYVRRGNEAFAAGRVADAADLWRSGFEMQKGKSPRRDSGREAILANAPALEAHAEKATQEKRWEEAFRCYAALIPVLPARADLSEKNDEAHRALARDLVANADALSRRGLVGAALVAELRALRHDPLHPTAFEQAERYRRTLAMRHQVSIEAVTIDDRGWWGLGNLLLPRLSKLLGSYPPYGPTKNPLAVPGIFLVTVEEFGWWDENLYGVEKRKLPKKEAASAERVPNPERAAQAKVVAELEREVAAMEAAIAAATPAEETKDAKKGKKGDTAKAPVADAKKGDKKAKGAAAEPERRVLAARTPTLEQLQRKKAELEKARASLAAMPETLEAKAAPEHWYLPWIETTRTVEARVRFEVREPDFPEPVVKVLTLRVEAKDRGHAAYDAHAVKADPMEVPHVEALTEQLAEKLTGGVEVIADARARRAQRLLARGQVAPSIDEALDAYVEALFVAGPKGLTREASSLVVSHLESPKLDEVVVSR